VQTQAMALAAGELSAPALRDALPGQTGRALQVALDELQTSVRAREAQRELLQTRATRDFLTGLLNREAALEALEHDLSSVRRSPEEHVLMVLYIDLDDFKGINDSFGHEAGDEALRSVGDALRATARESDVVARFGGDEFIVASLGRSGDEGLSLLANRICERVAAADVRCNGERIRIACSIGGALSEPSGDTVDALVERADRALYLAKERNRGGVHWYTPDLARRPFAARPEAVGTVAR
jgi:diguanylate cyclase (GGDEF)-like protein